MGRGLHSRINQQIKNKVIRGFVQNKTCEEFLRWESPTAHCSSVDTSQLQNRTIVVGFWNVDKGAHSLIIPASPLDSAAQGRKAPASGEGTGVTRFPTKRGVGVNPW